MIRWILAATCVIVLSPRGLHAACPSGYPGEILCDDFDTYCQGGGFPGDPHCDPLTASKNDTILRAVWRRTSANEGNGNLCGTEFSAEDIDNNLVSFPFGARFPGQANAVLGQQTTRDWITGSLGLSRLIGNTFGAPFTAVAGTDGAPLVMEFVESCKPWGALYFSSGYMELAMGEDRANTDFVYAPDCNTYCSPPIAQGPFPIMCAQANPLSPVPTGCPSSSTAPVRGAIAVGALGMLDTDPCHCGSTEAHGGQTYHLVVFDGKLWWTLRTNNPTVSQGTVTPVDGAPMPPPPEIHVPGDFNLNGGDTGGQALNWVKLTVRTTTFTVELNALEQSSTPIPDTDPVQYYKYYVSSVMDLPRQYLGPFDRVRGGVGAGCPLETNADWTTCALNPVFAERRCLDNNGPNAAYVDFDDFVLHAGAGYQLAGACCLPDATCTQTLAEECQSAGGLFSGPSSTCETVHCCPRMLGDTNADQIVDMVDFAVLQRCMTTGGGTTSAVCRCLDHNQDNDIDAQDVERFIECANGPAASGNSAALCVSPGWW